jgi:predicted RNase H-like HicB family nuclease
MTESVALDVHLRAFVRRDTPERWIATCPLVGVVTQGGTADDARRCLQEAVELWFESCVARGVLEQALREANFRPVTDNAASRQRQRRDQDSVLGESFEIHLSIPAYEAATVLGATA